MKQVIKIHLLHFALYTELFVRGLNDCNVGAAGF